MEYSLIDLANIKLSLGEWFLVAVFFIFVVMQGPPWPTPVPPRPKHHYGMKHTNRNKHEQG